MAKGKKAQAENLKSAQDQLQQLKSLKNEHDEDVRRLQAQNNELELKLKEGKEREMSLVKEQARIERRGEQRDAQYRM